MRCLFRAPVQRLPCSASCFYGIRARGCLVGRSWVGCCRVRLPRFVAPSNAVFPAWRCGAVGNKVCGRAAVSFEARAGALCLGPARLEGQEHGSSVRSKRRKPVTRFSRGASKSRATYGSLAHDIECAAPVLIVAAQRWQLFAIAVSRKDPVPSDSQRPIAARRRSARTNHARVVIRLPKPRANK